MFILVDNIQRIVPVVLILLDCEAHRNDELCLLVILSKHADVISFRTTTHRYCQGDVTMLCACDDESRPQFRLMQLCGQVVVARKSYPHRKFNHYFRYC